jgi:DNA-3-methyladenine glycosylase II
MTRKSIYLKGGIKMKIKSQDSAPFVQSTQDIEAVRIKLSELDPVLALAHEAVEPFEWHVRERGFAGLIQLIIEQQVSTASAAAIWKRFKAGVGKVTSKNLRKFEVDTLRTFGLSGPKAVYVLGIAEAEMTGAIDFGHLVELEDEEAIEKLTELKGVGRWTAEVYLMFCEGRTDLFPAGDLALQEGFRLAARGNNRPSEKELYARAESWRPYRGVAANLLWSYYRSVKSGEIEMPVGKQAETETRKRETKKRTRTPS